MEGSEELISARVGGCFVRTKNPKVEGGPKANVQIGNVYGNVNLADGSTCEGLAFPPKFDVGVTGDLSSLPLPK